MVVATRVIDNPTNPGDFKYFVRKIGGPVAGMRFVCPCGCGDVGTLHFMAWYKRPIWDWDANVESPTLHPSVHNKDGCGWHGFLTAGHWEPC